MNREAVFIESDRIPTRENTQWGERFKRRGECGKAGVSAVEKIVGRTVETFFRLLERELFYSKEPLFGILKYRSFRESSQYPSQLGALTADKTINLFFNLIEPCGIGGVVWKNFNGGVGRSRISATKSERETSCS